MLRGYEYFPGVGYYKFHSEGTHSFWDAKSICENEGGYLAIPNSQKEMNVYNQIYRRFSHVYNYAYLGFHDVHEEGRFVTIFGLLFIQWGDQLGTNAKTANKRSIGLQGCSK
ncbi:hypothetical protein J437_LFUL016950, partial [Ladona fulva]